MDDLDRKILGVIQSGFPLEARPYAVMGKDLGLTETEVLARVRALKESGVIRRIGANFQSGKLGWHSTLCAAKVPDEAFDDFVAVVNAHPGVTHNYLRDHEFNVWFTFIGETPEIAQQTLKDITAETGIDILYLPATKLFKIKVDFDMNKNGKES
ncbi:AsnC family transcriptional regulator [Desulfovibrio ferrophilus]|uniref:siroheme decarboxylase n=1 Tax=Desulfovibrio ferrophilus TaxID=241368 RepID=A0A2Z6AZF2_9BACT|nr:AsnC family transcriptional regulator [Desulfovibrio ferrophilus]BBD08651.1 AsnC family transcriptional regulator [Desulfovibrio ferrophilus]